MTPHPPLDLREVERTAIDDRTKGFPTVASPLALGDVASKRWSLFEDLPMPALILREKSLAHNITLMAGLCAEYGVDLAPHGKTTMAPQLWARQLEAGAWGITAATVGQARVMRGVGVRRVLLANELVDAPSIRWVADQLEDPSFELICCVDSARSVRILADELRRRGTTRPLRVLVELGHVGGRTGCRTVVGALEVADLVRNEPALELAGVAGYEGTICHERSEACVSAIASFLDELRRLAVCLIEASAFDEGEIVVTAGGSAFFDVVVERLVDVWPDGANVRVVLRSGCYLTHDSGHYEQISPLAAELDPKRRFHPAIEAWGSVLSRPEPDLAIVGLGKRDVPSDFGFPIAFTVRGAAGGTTDAAGRIEVVSLNDQHAFCRVDGGLRIEVGDRVCFGISHPCTAFDKWRVIAVLDEDSIVIDAVATFF